MTDLKITASAYQDPLFNQLRQQVSECSDHFPVLMLPVRLETRFRKVTRYVTRINPNERVLTDLLDRIWKQIYELRLANRSETSHTTNTLKKIIDDVLKSFLTLPDSLNRIKELDASDKQILRDSLKDFKAELDTPLFSKFAAVKSVAIEIRSVYNSLYSTVGKIPAPAFSPFQPGLDVLNELQKLEDEMAGIYGTNTIAASALDSALVNIETSMKRTIELLEEPGFIADRVTIANIQSKISYIKRSQKNSPVRLTDFKKSYTGITDLVSREYQLRNEINDLKTRIDEDYVPYMILLEKLQQFPVRQLGYLVKKCVTWLSASNNAGFGSADSLLEQREQLYKQLHKIREMAHRPLQGSVNDIRALKSDYDKLEIELNSFMDHSRKVNPLSTAHKAGLTRLRTHLSNEYLEDLKQLKTAEKTIESQAFSNEKIRTTAASAHTTLASISNANDLIKNINLTAEKAALLANARLIELDQRIKVTTSNTILLPREIYHETLNYFQSLKSQVNNFYSRNKISPNHFLKTSISASLNSIEDSLHDQQTDIFNERDRFYDEFRKRVTFLIRSETVKELWVRIYPDDIAVDNHDERLTDYELQVGKDYYNEIYSLPPDQREDAMLPAWRAAATSIGARRAAYVVKKLLPPVVKSNSVSTHHNQLQPVVDALTNAFSIDRVVWPAYHINQYSGFIISLPGTLQNILSKPYFTPCKLTRPDLELLSQTLQNALHYYESYPGGQNLPELAQYQTEYEALRFSLQISLEYFQKNLIALHEPFDPELDFPEVEMRSKEWDRAGISPVMPDRFIVVTKRDDIVRQIKVGRTISQSLNVGIDPDSDEQDEFYHLPNGDLNVPQKLRWMFDFDAAVDAGMAVRVPLQQEDFEKGFDFVMAYGIRMHQDLDPAERPAAGQQLLNDLLTNHLYSEGGLEYLPVGTATNNTDSVKSPYQTLDDDYDGLFKLFIKGEISHGELPYTDFNEMEISDGQFFRDALGIPLSIAKYIRNHDKKDIVLSRAMSRALYGGTLGYYTRFMLRNLLTNNDLFQPLPFMMRHVSAVGNLPSFRIDKQPYGIMPVTLHNKLWVDEPTTKGTFGSFIHKFSMFLAATRKVFENEMLKEVNTINSQKYSNDPQKAFLEILGLEPFSKEFIFREGANVGGKWGDIEGVEEAEMINWSEEYAVDPSKVSSHYEYLLNRLGHTTSEGRMQAMLKSRAYGARYVNSNDIIGHLVQNPKFGRGELEKQINNNANYIQWLSSRASSGTLSLFNIGKMWPIDGEYNTLLFELLRISLMYDNGYYSRRALGKIQNLDVPALERLMGGHLDLCSYRIDAWQTGLADYRLRELRTSQPTGIFVGAFGFVENLRQAPEKSKVQHFPEGLEPDDGSPVNIMPDNQGFIHGPSLNHAVTAAVLRAGYNSQKSNQTDTNNIFGINLSSARIRKALHMLEGAANGQESGALLGYMFERALHENYKDQQGKHLEMDAYIFRLRRKFPTYSDKLIDTATPSDQKESIRALNVIDGLEFLDYMEKFIISNSTLQWDDDKTFEEMLIKVSGSNIEFPQYPWGLKEELPPLTAADGAMNPEINKQIVTAIIREIDNMADSFDAMGDLITSEGVYQLVRGNHTRAGAVLSAMSEGRIPSDPEIIRSMREGTMVNHRVLLALKPETSSTNWSTIPESPRSKAEPALNSWLARQIGNPESIDFRVSFNNTTSYLSLADLELQPVDLAMLAGSGEEGLKELELRAADKVRQDSASSPEIITVDFYSSSPDAEISLGEHLALIQQLGKIAIKSRVADARDFRMPESDESFGMLAPSIDTDELLNRLHDAVDDYRSMLNKLSGFFTGQPVTDETILLAKERSAELTRWGFNGYYPDISDENDKSDLLARVISAKDRISRNLEMVDELLGKLTLEPEQTVWLDTTREISELLFGKGFKIIPRLILHEADTLKSSMNMPDAGGILRNISDDDLEMWLSDVAMVRKNLGPLDTARMLTEVIHGQKTAFCVAQLPTLTDSAGTTDDYWLGSAYPESWEPETDKLSLVVFDHNSLAYNCSAIVFDEWTEIIPSKTQTTGIALHYNQPDARPPQALMLAVSPDVTGQWSVDDLGLIVEEFYKMAKIRAVEPDHFNNTLLAQLLPATTMLSGGEEDVVRAMFDIPISQTDIGRKGVLSDFSSINSGITKDEL